MKSVAVACLLAFAACAPPFPDGDDAPPVAWPPPAGTAFTTCSTVATGDPCTADDAGWCNDCYAMIGCYCDGEHYECFAAESICEFGGAGAECPREGTPACNTPPAPAYCTCTAAGTVDCTYVCPLAECPDYDPGSSSCVCASGDCS